MIASFVRVSVISLAMLVLGISTLSVQRVTWVKWLSGPSFDDVNGFYVGADGSTSLSGTFSDSINVDGFVLQSVGNYDIYTARSSAKGNPVTASAHGSYDVDEARSIAAGNKGNTYFTGAFIDEAVVAGELIESLDPSSMDMFVAKVSKEGILQWVRVFGSLTEDEGAPSVAVDSTGNVYVAGGIGGNGQFGTKTYRAVGKLDAFVAKLNANGEFQWVQGAGAADNDQVLHIQVTPNADRIYTVGTFISLVNFGSNSIESFAGRADVFVRAHSATGQPLWAKRIGSAVPDVIVGASLTVDGKLLVTGPMYTTTTFDTQTRKADGDNAPDVYVARVNKEGSFEFLRHYGDIFEEISTCIVSDAKGNMFVGGTFDSTMIMDTFQEESRGRNDAFLMRLLANGEVDWVKSWGGPYEDAVRGVGLDSKGIPYITGVVDGYGWFDDLKLEGEGFDEVFVAAVDCGPSTQLRPLANEIKICEGMERTVTARLGYPSYEWFVNGTMDSEKGFVFKTTNLKVGSYKVYCRIKGHDECIKNTDTMTITVTPGLPVPTITRSGDELTCSNDKVNYQWYREGQKIAGATSRTVKIQGEGNYRVLIKDTAGCERWSENFLVGTTSINDLVEGSAIAVYPNPTSGLVTLTGAEGVEITVTDVMGRTVAFVASAGAQQQLSIEGATGTFMLTLRTAERTSTMMIQKR